jgi:hypothetical protein
MMWLGLAWLTVLSLVYAGESGMRVVTGLVALTIFGLCAARAATLGYVAIPEGLAVVGLITTRVIPWQHIARIEVTPHRWSAQGDLQPSDLFWLTCVEAGSRRSRPLFTIRTRAAAHRLAASLTAEVRSHRLD